MSYVSPLSLSGLQTSHIVLVVSHPGLSQLLSTVVSPSVTEVWEVYPGLFLHLGLALSISLVEGILVLVYLPWDPISCHMGVNYSLPQYLQLSFLFLYPGHVTDLFQCMLFNDIKVIFLFYLIKS